LKPKKLCDQGTEWAHGGVYRSVADNLRIVENLSVADLERVMARWPLDGPGVTVLAGPAGAEPSSQAG